MTVKYGRMAFCVTRGGFKSWFSPVIQKALVMYHWQPVKWEGASWMLQCNVRFCTVSSLIFNKIWVLGEFSWWLKFSLHAFNSRFLDLVIVLGSWMATVLFCSDCLHGAACCLKLGERGMISWQYSFFRYPDVKVLSWDLWLLLCCRKHH